MPKLKTTTTCERGTNRIDQIKSTISNFKPATCKAEVYETWDNIFEPEEESQ